MAKSDPHSIVVYSSTNDEPKNMLWSSYEHIFAKLLCVFRNVTREPIRDGEGSLGFPLFYRWSTFSCSSGSFPPQYTHTHGRKPVNSLSLSLSQMAMFLVPSSKIKKLWISALHFGWVALYLFKDNATSQTTTANSVTLNPYPQIHDLALC